MSQVIQVWLDLLCSECYHPLAFRKSLDCDIDEPIWCDRCEDWSFPIVIMKREYNIALATPKGHQTIQSDIPHGIEILHIGGAGIVTTVEKGEDNV